MRILVAGKEPLTKQQELEWQRDGQHRVLHVIPDKAGDWHYAYTLYLMRAGTRTKALLWCPKCDRGAVPDVAGASEISPGRASTSEAKDGTSSSTSQISVEAWTSAGASAVRARASLVR